MVYTPFLAGQKVTAGTLNSALLSGVLVFRAYRSTAQSIPTRASEVVGDAIQWDDIGLDRLGGWNSATPTRYTCTTAGWHTFSGSIGYNADTTGTIREAIWYSNGVLLAAGRSVPIANSGIASIALTAEARRISLNLSVGDYLELVPLQNGTGPISSATGSPRSYITIHYAGLP